MRPAPPPEDALPWPDPAPPFAIRLGSGAMFDFAAEGPREFNVLDAAHALGKICRFTGQCWRFYSVAEHSVLVSRMVAPEHALAGLLHDAHEAFVGDVAAPLKALLADYRALEDRIAAEVRIAAGLPPNLPPEVDAADKALLAFEMAELFGASAMVPRGALDAALAAYPRPRIDGWEPALAAKNFMLRFVELVRR